MKMRPNNLPNPKEIAYGGTGGYAKSFDQGSMFAFKAKRSGQPGSSGPFKPRKPQVSGR